MRRMLGQLTLTHLLVAFASVTLVACVSSVLFSNRYTRQRNEDLVQAARDIARIAQPLLRLGDRGDLALLAQAAGAALGGNVCILGPGEAELIAASFQSGRTPSPAQIRQLGAAVPGSEAVVTACTECQGLTATCTAAILDPETHAPIGSVLVRSPISGLERIVSDQWANGLVAALAAAFFALIPAWLLSRALSRPLERISRAAAGLAEGDFGVRVRPEGPLELALLAKTVNWSAEQLQGLFTDLSSERGRLADVLASMQEGVVACHDDGTVLLANDAACRLLGLPSAVEAIGSPLEDLVPDDGVREGILHGRAEPLLVGGRTLQVRSTELANRAGSVCVLIDVTDQERLARTRREFVANASHQLRSPLTSIRGYLEAVSDGTAEGSEDQARCISVALEQVVGLQTLVAKLLQLSRLQAGAAVSELALVALPELACRAADYARVIAERRGVEIRVESDEERCVEADPELLLQAAGNLLDNAIRHTPRGGVVTLWVGARPNANGGLAELAVRDQGPGLPEGDLERIWERFTSGSTAGAAGLGLAIVREIVEAHAGEVFAQSNESGGAVFGFRLPAV